MAIAAAACIDDNPRCVTDLIVADDSREAFVCLGAKSGRDHGLARRRVAGTPSYSWRRSQSTGPRCPLKAGFSGSRARQEIL